MQVKPRNPVPKRLSFDFLEKQLPDTPKLFVGSDGNGEQFITIELLLIPDQVTEHDKPYGRILHKGDKGYYMSRIEPMRYGGLIRTVYGEDFPAQIGDKGSVSDFGRADTESDPLPRFLIRQKLHCLPRDRVLCFLTDSSNIDDECPSPFRSTDLWSDAPHRLVFPYV